MGGFGLTSVFFFFFQAEDGIRDLIVTGVQTCALPIFDINEMGLPAGTEALDPISPQYLGDLISWSAIGADRKSVV